MSEIVTAVYENGMLRPLEPLKLRERQTVRIQVLTGDTGQEVDEVVRSLVEAGLMRARPERDIVPPPPLSWDERRRLADRLGEAPGKLASDMVIEDRGEG
jgi:predicted DNA-binding antitoxin AbrB/MazE fold protein